MKIPNFYATTLKYDIDAVTTTIGVTTLPKDEQGNVITNGILVLEARSTDRHEIIEYTSVDGTDLKGVTRGLGGTSGTPHKKNAIIEGNATGLHLTRLYDAFDNFVSTNDGRWNLLPQVPTLVATNGQRSFDISYAGDLTAIFDKGARLRIPRTIAPPTQSAGFNGTTAYASKASPTGFTFVDNYTLEANVYINAYGAEMSIISRYTSSPTQGFRLLITDTGRLNVSGYKSNGNWLVRTSNQAIPLGKWVHVAATVNHAVGTTVMYIDGVAVEFDTVGSGGTPNQITQAGDLSIGRQVPDNRYFNGGISDVRVWSMIRTQQQIRDNMNQQLVGNESNLVGYWKLNGNFNDSTANANTLVAAGGAVANIVASPFASYAYAIVMTTPVYSGGITTMTVQCPIGYNIPNTLLGQLAYSFVKTPYGFPNEPSLWTVLALYNSMTISTGVSAATWTQLPMGIQLPVGNWNIGYQGVAFWSGTSASYPNLASALSSVPNAASNYELNAGSSGGNLAMTAWRDGHSADTNLSNTLSQFFRLQIRNKKAGTAGFVDVDNTPTRIYATCGYL